VERIGGGTLRHDAETDANLLVWFCLALLEVLVLVDIFLQLGVHMKFMRKRILS
jgi:hypothetical protein